MVKYKNPQNQSKGILDDFAVRKTIETRQGTITKTPVNDLDIANKKYVDDNAGGAPGGSDTQVQFNDGGATFGGDAGLTYNKTTDKLTVVGDLQVNDQILAKIANRFSPGYSFQGDPNTGITSDTANEVLIIASGDEAASIRKDSFRVRGAGNKDVPSYSFTNDQNTGIFNSDDVLGFSAGAVEFMRLIETTQNVMVFNEGGLDIDFRVETDTEPNFFFINGADNTLRIGDMDTNYAQFAVDGELTLVGTARVKKDIAIPLDGIGMGATAPTVTRLANTYGYAFTIGDDGYIQFEIPTDWDTTTDIEIAIHIYTNETFANNSAETQWQGLYSVIPEDGSEAVDGATHTGTLDSGDVNIPATAKGLQEITIGTIPAADLAIHDVVAIKLSRVALDAGNNPSPEPVLIQAEYEYTANKLGEAT